MKKIALMGLVTTGLLYGSFFDSVKQLLPQETTTKNSTQENQLVSNITKETGLSTAQATGTVGTLMQYAKSNMTNEEYQTVTKDVPVLNSLGGTSSLISSLSDGIVSNETVASSLKTLGVDPTIVKTIIPIIVNYATSLGGEETGGILSKSLSGLLQ